MTARAHSIHILIQADKLCLKSNDEEEMLQLYSVVLFYEKQNN